jgi:23S rRNA (adenine1618-N6)-methyltransferase
MASRASIASKASGKLHPRNIHQGRYNLSLLAKKTPELLTFIVKSPAGASTIDFANSDAVMMLNKALLKHYYKVADWSIPKGYLCPPIPGRADYIHYAADLLAKSSGGKIPKGNGVRLLDIGTGANLVYPIIANASYGWQCMGTDINQPSVLAANRTIDKNASLKANVAVVLQVDTTKIFSGIVKPDDRFSLSVCNPPFHASAKEAQASTQRKVANLSKNKHKNTKHSKVSGHSASLNFGGQHNELWCDGGEVAFISQMIDESKMFATNVCWFSCLVSKNDHLKILKKRLNVIGVTQIEVINMAQGQKVSRFIAWTFLTDAQRDNWFLTISQTSK